MRDEDSNVVFIVSRVPARLLLLSLLCCLGESRERWWERGSSLCPRQLFLLPQQHCKDAGSRHALPPPPPRVGRGLALSSSAATRSSAVCRFRNTWNEHKLSQTVVGGGGCCQGPAAPLSDRWKIVPVSVCPTEGAIKDSGGAGLDVRPPAAPAHVPLALA